MCPVRAVPLFHSHSRKVKVLRMDDNDDVVALLNRAMQSHYGTVELPHKQGESYQALIDYYLNGIQDQISSMDKQLKDRTSRIRLTTVVGAIAIIAGVLALWDSSSIGAGFHQTLLIATGGALITFCLVELILDKIVEIPSKKQRRTKSESTLSRPITKNLQIEVRLCWKMIRREMRVWPRIWLS